MRVVRGDAHLCPCFHGGVTRSTGGGWSRGGDLEETAVGSGRRAGRRDPRKQAEGLPTVVPAAADGCGEAGHLGRTVRARFAKNVSRGSLLVAVVSRLSSRTLAPTVGQVADNRGNHWLQAVEYFTADHYGVDIWYCESAGGGNRPLVTGVCLGYPVHPGTDGMRLTLFEYSGAHGFELCDQICQANITGTTATATTNFDLRADDELAVSAIVGDMTSATAPDGWTTRLADREQRCYVSDTLSTGASRGRPIECRLDRTEGRHCRRRRRRDLRAQRRDFAGPSPGAVFLHGLGDPPRGEGSCQVAFAALPR